MGKFERKVNKKLNEDIEDFNEWYKKNKSKFDSVDKEREIVQTGNVAAKQKSRFIYIAIGTAFILCLLVAGFFVYNKLNQRFNSDNVLIYANVTESEMEDISKRYSFLTETEIQSATKIYERGTDVLLAVSISAELEYGENYYFIDFDIELDKSYSDFMATEYSDFSTTIEIESYSVSYKLVGQDSDSLYNYLMLITTDSEQKIYVQANCFEDDLGGIFEILKN